MISHANGSCLNDVQALRAFEAVAQSLNFTRAAQSLGLTQSAISQTIARLERGLAAALFLRGARRVSLTPAGQVLRQYATRVFDLLDEAASSVKTAASPEMGRLRIGASVTVCQFFLPDVLREFRECFPSYSLSIVPGDGPDVRQRLLDGSIDVGLLIRPEGSTRLNAFELFSDSLGIVTSPHHHWAAAGKVDLGQVEREQFVLYARTSATFKLIERYFVRIRRPLREPIELGSIEAIKELVKLGLGVSVLAPWVMARELAERSLVWQKLPGPALKRKWIVATPRKEMSLADQTFVDLCRSVSKEITRGGL